jgi:hypothetical protein
MRTGALLGVVLATGCRDAGGGGSYGALGFATFRWECAGEGDAACAATDVAGLAGGVALGSTFAVSFVLNDEVPREVEAGWLELVGSSRAQELSSSNGSSYDDYDGLRSPSGSFRASAEGQVTMMAFAQDDTVADYTTVWIQPVTSLGVVRDCRTRTCVNASDGEALGSVIAGQIIDVRVEAYGDAELLVGAIDYTWESLTPEVAAVVEGGGPVVGLDLLAEGTAYLRVQGGGLEDTVAITVITNGPHRRRPGESEGETEGSGTDTGTGTESGTDTGTDTGTETDAATGTTTGGMQ